VTDQPVWNVLIVDDETDIVELICADLDSRGFTATGVTAGSLALKALESKNFDVMLLDMSMPEMSGVEVIRAVRARSDSKLLPIIMLSALVDAESVIACFDAGANDYVTKPPDFSELAARLRRHAQLASQLRNTPRAQDTSQPMSDVVPAIADAPAPVTNELELDRLKIAEAAVKQISLAVKLAQEKQDQDFRDICLKRIQSFCAVALKAFDEVFD